MSDTTEPNVDGAGETPEQIIDYLDGAIENFRAFQAASLSPLQDVAKLAAEGLEMCRDTIQNQATALRAQAEEIRELREHLSRGSFVSHGKLTQGKFVRFCGHAMSFDCIDGEVLVRAWYAEREDCRQVIRSYERAETAEALSEEQAAVLRTLRAKNLAAGKYWVDENWGEICWGDETEGQSVDSPTVVDTLNAYVARIAELERERDEARKRPDELPGEHSWRVFQLLGAARVSDSDQDRPATDDGEKSS